MTESQLQLGNDLKKDRNTVYSQMSNMKSKIQECSRLAYQTTNCKEDFEEFKQSLLNQCDEWVESQRAKIDEAFNKI